MLKKFCLVSIKSTGLLTCLSVSTMCLLIFTTIVIITVISVIFIIILGLGEINAGQRDVILSSSDPLDNLINTTRIAEVSGQKAMPRIRALITLNGAFGIGWFMDFDLEQQQHLGTLPITPEQTEDDHFVYVHKQFGFKEGDKLQIGLRTGDILLAMNYTVFKQKPEHYRQIMQEIDFIANNGVMISG